MITALALLIGYFLKHWLDYREREALRKEKAFDICCALFAEIWNGADLQQDLSKENRKRSFALNSSDPAYRPLVPDIIDAFPVFREAVKDISVLPAKVIDDVTIWHDACANWLAAQRKLDSVEFQAIGVERKEHYLIAVHTLEDYVTEMRLKAVVAMYEWLLDSGREAELPREWSEAYGRAKERLAAAVDSRGT
ncbi:MAG TPA: hypothetical protein VJ890_08975 [Vineibacter sp.]|nr:hypothetical protein [Vineibacter sp.]